MTREELLTEDISLRAEIRAEQASFNEKKHKAAMRHRENLNTEYARYDEERRELEEQRDKAVNGYLARRDEISLELARLRAAEEEAG